MAMIDYGALLRVDGNFLNKNQGLFMESSDTGYKCINAICNGEEVDIDGNYFVYAGDENFLIVFYKGIYRIISHNKVLLTDYSMPFISITHYFNDLATVTVSHLDDKLYFEKADCDTWTWKEYVKENWIGASGDEKLSELVGGYKEYKKFCKYVKKIARVNKNGGCYAYRTDRYLAEWEYKGKKYEVIFGLGIEPVKEVWDDIKTQNYGFTDVEKIIIEKWFGSS